MMHTCCSMRHWADLALLERPLHRRLQRLAGSRLMGVVSLLAPLLSLGEKGLRDRGMVIHCSCLDPSKMRSSTTPSC